MTSNAFSAGRPIENSRRGAAGALNRLNRPLLLLGVASIIVATVGAESVSRGSVADQYLAAYVTALLLATAPPLLASSLRQPSDRPKLVYFGSVLPGVTAGMVTFNGMSTGLPRIGFAIGALSFFVVATIALFADVE